MSRRYGAVGFTIVYPHLLTYLFT